MKPTENAHVETNLYPYQEAGCEFLMTHRTAFLGDEMGLGKSAQAIRAADNLKLKRVLVIAPTIALYNWEHEWWKFSRYDRLTQVIDTGRSVLLRNATVHITTPNLMKAPKVKSQLLRQAYDVVIVDEADMFKNANAQRTKALYGDGCARRAGCIAALADRVWCLSGTPAPNHAGELWTHLHALRPDLIPQDRGAMNYHTFINRFCILKHSSFGVKVMGNKADELPILRDRIVKPFILRRLKKNVLRDLPPIRYDVVKLPPAAVTGNHANIENELEEVVHAFLRQVEQGADAAELLIRLQKETPHLATLRHLTALLKVPATVDLIESHYRQTQGRKLIVFAHHLQALRGLGLNADEKGWKWVSVTGDDTAKARAEKIQRFQEDPECGLFLGQITACATAVNITAASDVFFLEGSWCPRDNAQAAARTHRIGQTNPVFVKFLALSNSIDEAVMSTLARKVRQTKELYE